MFFAVLVPTVNLHFYLVFPRPNPILLVYRRWVLAALYGVPGAFLAALWGAMFASRWLRDRNAAESTTALELTRILALSYVWVAVFCFALCLFCLVFSYRRRGIAASGTRSSGSCWRRWSRPS